MDLDPTNLEASDKSISAGIDQATDQDALTHEIVNAMQTETTKLASWTQNLVLLIVSLGAFAVLSRVQNDWTWTGLLIPALLIHEFGHLMLMRACGYRNTKIFFIPFFGAAASGINFNVPGWKRVVVVLAGPLFGLAIGGLAGVVGMMLEQPLLIRFSVISAALNLFNLLPIVPLDGGWVMFHLVFCRHPFWDGAFRAFGAIGLFAVAFWTGQIVLGIVAFYMLLGAFRAFKIGKVARQLREEGIQPATEDQPGLDSAIAFRVADGIRTAFQGRSQLPIKLLAVYSLEAYSLIHGRPPGLLASLLFALIQVGSFVVGTVWLLAMTVFQQANQV